METLFKPGDQVVLRTDLSAGMFYPMLEKKEVDGETYYLPSSDLATAKAASWEMIDWINKSSFKTATIESIKNGVYRLTKLGYGSKTVFQLYEEINGVPVYTEKNPAPIVKIPNETIKAMIPVKQVVCQDI